MIKKNYLLLLGVVSFFFACSEEIDYSSPASPVSQEATIVNLQELDYESLTSVLSGISTQEKSLVIKDGEVSKEIILSRKKHVKIAEGSNEIVLYNGRITDSTNIAMSPSFATLRIWKNGELISYVTYNDSEEMQKVANYYLTRFLPQIATRNVSIDDIVTCMGPPQTRSGVSDVACVRINTTKAIEYSPYKNKDYQVKQGECCSSISDLTTYEANPFPANIHFMLLKEKDGGSLDHEITWQIESTTTSLDFLINSGFIEPSYTILDSTHKGVNDYPSSALFDFHEYLTKWDTVAGQGDRVFILMRDGQWDNDKILGEVVDLGVIHPYIPVTDFSINALSTSSSKYPHTLAHEVGHLLGATHVNNEEDLMNGFYSPKLTPHHLSGDNWERMLNCLLQKP